MTAIHDRYRESEMVGFSSPVLTAAAAALAAGLVATTVQAASAGIATRDDGSATTSTRTSGEPQRSSQDVFTVYMAPEDEGGSDTNDGLSSQTGVYTLERVEEVLEEHDPSTDVEVRIAPGTYIAPPYHEWRFYIPDQSVSFMPLDYEPGDDIDDLDSLPVFRNDQCGDTYCEGFWLQPRLPLDEDDPLYDGGDSNLAFYYLQVEYYSSGGLSIFGNSERDWEDDSWDPPLHIQASDGLNNNLIFGMQFRNLGNQWSGGSWGYGGIVLTNSSDNRIANSHFVNLENSDNPGNIHGLYITHHSSDNLVEGNRFSTISGYPVKVRNQSNDNQIENNTINRAGRDAYYRGEFCDTDCAVENEMPQQCASWGNRFFDNTLQGNYEGEQPSLWSLDPDGLTHPGGEPCSARADDQRVYTGGNVIE